MARGAPLECGVGIAEFRAGRLSGALDVTGPEPLPVDSPPQGLPNGFITPRLAGSPGRRGGPPRRRDRPPGGPGAAHVGAGAYREESYA
ncbi:hypothetical protein [Streptomyces viridochromogenes]|uniref:hypothetical protein n=1 Tax=Streptomyces viridochromogenes TaxID=1938 RepID=UPI00030D7B8B|nr:hypothetical protein [Streptomyces viridochromogenes]